MKESLFVTIKLHFTLYQTRFSMKEPNIEIDCYFIREKLLSGEITTDFVNSSNQLANVFAKSLEALRLNTFVTSLVHMTYMLQLEGDFHNLVN